MVEIEVIAGRCTGCGECVAACPFWAIEVVEGVAVVAESCTGCGACIPPCPEGALVQPGAEVRPSLGGRRAIWVYLPEARDPAGVLGVARVLADEGDYQVAAVVPGNSFDSQELFSRGADQVLVLEGEGAGFRLLASAAARESPVAILGLAEPHHEAGLARAAVLLEAGVASRVEAVEWAPGQQALRAVRAVAGGRFRQTVVCGRQPAVVSLVPWGARSGLLDRSRTGSVRHLEVGGLPREVEEVRERTPLHKEVPLGKARVVLGVGIELGSAEAVAEAVELARRWGAALGAEKEAVEAGLAPAEWSVEAAGPLAPVLYLGLGVRGSPAHNAAVQKSQLVVAVTTEQDSNLGQIADYIVRFPPREVLRTLLSMSAP
ncbi:MAG: 4Fe-4S binding protein [Bacillota bacterium]|nr:4Fe-4S binding protein [Bacillota bacterium]